MPKQLSPEAVVQYERDGFYFPLRAIPAEEAQAVRADVEAAERHFAERGERRPERDLEPDALATYEAANASHNAVLYAGAAQMRG